MQMPARRKGVPSARKEKPPRGAASAVKGKWLVVSARGSGMAAGVSLARAF